MTRQESFRNPCRLSRGDRPACQPGISPLTGEPIGCEALRAIEQLADPDRHGGWPKKVGHLRNIPGQADQFRCPFVGIVQERALSALVVRQEPRPSIPVPQDRRLVWSRNFESGNSQGS